MCTPSDFPRPLLPNRLPDRKLLSDNSVTDQENDGKTRCLWTEAPFLGWEHTRNGRTRL